uniref:non-specific serine/threonine protein kinase n=2 Tax=Kalmanozyma brasiliensis (strain GHG001) TaxID=1365824 RepID=V5EUS3_KALBG
MSVSSVSSVNSTSSLEAVPFREAPLGNTRVGFGGTGGRFAGRNARNQHFGSLAMSTQLSSSHPVKDQSLSQLAFVNDQREELAPDASHLSTAAAAGHSTDPTLLSSSAPASDRHKGVPKQATDAWMYRVGPGMRTNKPARGSPVIPDTPEDDSQSAASPAKRSREVLRQKFAKGAGRLGIKANIVTVVGPTTSDQYTVYNPLDSSEDETTLVPPNRTPLPRSSSYFSTAQHSAGSSASTPLHPILTPVPADFRTSSVTNAPLFVPKFADDMPSSRLTPEPLAPASQEARQGATTQASAAPSLPPLSYGANVGSITSDLSPYITGGTASANHGRRRSSVSQKPVYSRAESSNDALDRVASPGLLVADPSAVNAPPAEPALYTLSTSSALPANRSPQVEPIVTSGSSKVQASPHPTPAEVVRMEAQAGIASLPDSPSEPSPVPASYSPVIVDEAANDRRTRGSSHSRSRRPSSVAGSEAPLPAGPATAASSRRPESTQRQRLWSNAKRPAILRARTSESSMTRGRRSQSLDRKASSPNGQSPVDDPMYDAGYDRPGTHSKSSSNGTLPVSGESAVRMPPHVAVIPEDDDGANGSIDAPDRTLMPASASNSPALSSSSALQGGADGDQIMALSSPNGVGVPFLVQSNPPSRSASPASQLARSPETIRVGPGRVMDSIYGRSPASISNLRSPRLLPSSASITSMRPATPSQKTSSARGPNDFHFGDTLGEGSYSTVLEAWDLLTGPAPKEPGVVDPNAISAATAMVGAETSKKRRRRIDLTGRKAYAIKVLDKVHILKQGKQKYVAIEKEALSRMIRHPGVVTLFWTFQDRESLYFVLELASNGELLNFIRKHGSFDVDSARFYAAQLADTIDAMHTAGVVHRDVKPENILLDARRRMKITDFGSAKIVHAVDDVGGEASTTTEAPAQKAPGRAASFVGTAEYVSPELLVEKAQPAGKPADWWAFGCVLFQMLAGRPPFKGVNEYQTLQKVKHREFSFPQGFPEDAQDLIDRVLVLDPAQRPSAAEIKGHAFFRAIDFGRLWEMEVPEIKTGLVQPLPPAQQRGFGDNSDFSFDDGFGSSDESQAYNGDTQSIDLQNRSGGADESSMSVDALSSTQPNDADDSDMSDASSDRREATSSDGAPKRQSGLQRLADGFHSRFMSNASGSGTQSPSSQQQGTGSAPRRRFSTMSIDAVPAPANTAENHTGNEASASSASRNMRPFSRPTQPINHQPASASPSSMARAAQPPATSGGLQQSWGALLLPKELMLYTVPVAQKKTGTGKMFTKRRQLILTDFPRLLCVKETATALKVKSEVILAIDGSTATGDSAGDFERVSGRHAAVSDGENEEMTGADARSAQQAIPNLLAGLEYRGGRAFTVKIANGRTFLYETAGDASGLVRSIQEARKAGS